MMSWRRGQAYAQHLRDRVLVATGTLGELAQRFGVSSTYVWRVRSRCSQLGQTSAGAQVNHVPLRLDGLQETPRVQVALAPPSRRWRCWAAGRTRRTALRLVAPRCTRAWRGLA